MMNSNLLRWTARATGQTTATLRRTYQVSPTIRRLSSTTTTPVLDYPIIPKEDFGAFR
eukprot:CAMPEP_0172454064 /NCGR_PEP_ID=MMETSP1065-20121228/11163_1 /TAXON_ID=265537 /ORGANISM="Amphiprora paludosa, Strain CCMP125" /LENGTH=57 /DNA_ID=CAMNT_0013206325 /DNA_START=58 /DNA_END=228 /DNA_ORIENTATION=+